MHYFRDTWIEVNLDDISENYLKIQHHQRDGTKVMAIVKADGYGHGAYQVANHLIESGVDYLGVALLDEAIALRQSGIEVPILVLGWVAPEHAPIASKNGISLTIFQNEWLQQVALQENPLNLHVKFDTGMGRLGINDENEAKLIINKIKENPSLKLEGAFSHFATADELDSELVQLQKNRFSNYLSLINAEGLSVEMVHFGNSAGAIRFPDDEQHYVRVGISLYGLSPSEEMKSVIPFSLKQAFSLHSKLTHVKQISPGDTISYGATYQADETEWVGTVPIGYADGWIRRYAEKGHILVQGHRCKIVGRICMDQLIVKLPFQVDVGTQVTLVGKQADDEITIDEIAQQNDTINYEVPCLISSRVPRVYKKNNQIIETVNQILNN
ncbi:alanine racemase [Pseudalkalibacillus berkeleyi]|uniref:Alanine racemase n=1 Tax=Pseudalkalibacillus berkeleyi TaxID=1069813 RepID=A0ABS9H319_9BACL|nr:alanine racemase [Pseudalkalibacillus berkeleyi]MCF6139354.1 alanine racemase [Pseudalkalibacillus berkeleyi]